MMREQAFNSEPSRMVRPRSEIVAAAAAFWQIAELLRR
jgi:hypothetical protein